MYSNMQTSIREGPDLSSDEEELIVKNIDTGQTHSYLELTKDLSPITPPKQVWSEYFSSLGKLGDKLLQLLMKKERQKIQQFLIEYPVDLNELKYFGGWTLLHFAVSVDDPAIADLLMKFGLDANAQTTQMKRTALMEAAQGNKVEIVEILIGWGADPNLADSDGNTALHFAVDYSHFEVVKILIASSTPLNVNARNNMNMTPFNTCRSPEIFQILIAYSNKTENTLSNQSKQTVTTRNTYESRLIVRNSEVVPHTSRVDVVEKFLSLREQPDVKVTGHNFNSADNYSVISEESYEESGLTTTTYNMETPAKKDRKKKVKKIGTSFASHSLKSSFRIAEQNIGLMRESIIKTHLENEEVIENYNKLRKLGQGAFAQVFLVRRKKSNMMFALKAIDKVRVADDKLKPYIYAQRQVLTKINHPFLLHAHYCLQDYTHLYILTEFCNGGDLQKIVREHPLPEDIARTYVCQAALALEELHKNKVLYRDLKAANALLDAEGHLRLADFGLAKLADTSVSFLGSMNYLAPEMLAKGEEKPHGKALDWYLLGVFAYQLLHGQPPFYCQDREEAERRILQQDPTFDQKLSIQCTELIAGLLAKDKSKRLTGIESIKASKWMEGVNWQAILDKKGKVYVPEVESLKDLRKKDYFEEGEDEKIIDMRIEWYDQWNYPVMEKSP